MQRLNHGIIASLLINKGSDDIEETSNTNEDSTEFSRIPETPARQKHDNANDQGIASNSKLLVDTFNGTEAIEEWEPNQRDNKNKKYQGNNPVENAIVLFKGKQCA